MFRRRRSLVVVLVTVLLAGTVAGMFILHNNKTDRLPNGGTTLVQEPGGNLKKPEFKWERSFFKSLGELTKNFNLRSLRTVLPQDDLEIRFWYDGLPRFIDGLVLRRSSGEWSAVRLHGVNDGRNFQLAEERLPAPKSGWLPAWERLTSTEILTLPDASEVECNIYVLDGGGVVVEANVNGTYKTYRYSSPQLQKCKEGKEIVRIEEIIYDEFLEHSRN